MAASWDSRSKDPMIWMPSSVKDYHYYCPDLAHVDQHIKDLRSDEYLGERSALTLEAKARWCADLDRLLDRRNFLMMMGEAA